jgi:hypothetical protein
VATGDGESFWWQTPKTLALAFKAHAERRDHQWKLAAWSVWHAEALARTKKLPPLDTFMGVKKRPKKQTPDEILAALGAIVGPPPEAT